MRLGEHLRDVVSGFEGYAVGRADYLTGCEQWMLEAPASDGARKTAWFDVDCLEPSGQPALELPGLVAVPSRGGPRPAPR